MIHYIPNKPNKRSNDRKNVIYFFVKTISTEHTYSDCWYSVNYSKLFVLFKTI